MVRKLRVQQGCIYLVRNLVNGKGYVGQHKGANAERRWTAHIARALRGSKVCVHAAIRKYGAENFSAEVIWSGEPGLLNKKETFYIKKLGTFAGTGQGQGYNLNMGGDAPSVVAPSVRARLSEASKLQHQDPLMKEKLSNIQKHVWQDPGLRAVLSAAQKKLWSNPAYKKTRLLTAEQKFARSERMKLWWASPGVRQNLCAAQLRRRERERMTANGKTTQ